MGNDELLNYISMFREKAEQGKLVIFVGAGVSCNVDGMPSWNALIQNMAKAIDYSRCDTCRHRLESCENTCLLKDDFSTDELLKVPQHVFNKDQELYYRILNESIPAVTADAPLSSAIFDINPAHIITTNYDQLLESSKNIFCEQYQVIVYDKDLLNADKGKYIIKMHGDLSDASSIVLKEQDYLDYSQKHVLIELFIKSLLTDHIVLFLGYSLNDYNIKLIHPSFHIGGFQMTETRAAYHKEVKTASFQGKSITVENLTPVLSPKARDKRKREIESCLYEVFVKYAPGRAQMH